MRKLHYIATGNVKKVTGRKPQICPGYGLLKSKCKAQLKTGQELCTKCNRQKTTDAFARLLNSPESKQRLASAMANPIRQQLDYESVFRAACTVEPLPTNMLEIPQNRISIPEFEIQSTPSINFSELRERQFNAVKSKKKKLKNKNSKQ